jgi:hypothetical protein
MGHSIGCGVHGQIEKQHKAKRGVDQEILVVVQAMGHEDLEGEVSHRHKHIGGGKDDAALQKASLCRAIFRLDCSRVRAHDFACHFIEYEPIASFGARLGRKVNFMQNRLAKPDYPMNDRLKQFFRVPCHVFGGRGHRSML